MYNRLVYPHINLIASQKVYVLVTNYDYGYFDTIYSLTDYGPNSDKLRKKVKYMELSRLTLSSVH